MSMQREAMNLALKCLSDPWSVGPDSLADAIVALREALAQSEQEQVKWIPSDEWTPCVKLPVTVHVRAQRPGETHVSTREGIAPIKADDLIMRGVEGEEYPIGREIFERTYQLGEALSVTNGKGEL